MSRLSTDLKFRYVMLCYVCAASVTWQVTSSRREARTNVRRNLAILSILARRETGFDCRATLHWPHRGLLAAAAVNDTRTPHPLSSLHAALPSGRNYAISLLRPTYPHSASRRHRSLTNPHERRRAMQRANARGLLARWMNSYAI